MFANKPVFYNAFIAKEITQMRFSLIHAVTPWVIAALSAQILIACSETANHAQNPPFITCAAEGGCGARPVPLAPNPER